MIARPQPRFHEGPCRGIAAAGTPKNRNGFPIPHRHPFPLCNVGKQSAVSTLFQERKAPPDADAKGEGTMPPVTNRPLALVALWAALVLPGQAAADAAIATPEAMLQETAHQMFAALEENRGRLERQPRAIYGIVEKVLVPHVDLRHACRWVLGRHWRSATPEQRRRFSEQFRTHLIRFYSHALVNYMNLNGRVGEDVISFLPQRRPAAEAQDATVHTTVERPDGSAVPVNYRLHRIDGRWQVYDVVLNGVSVISAYRSVLSSEVDQRGLDAVIASLTEHNRRL